MAPRIYPPETTPWLTDELRVRLTPAQAAVLSELVVGAGRLVIASRLHLSQRTVDSRIAEIKAVLGASSRLCLGARAIRYGLVGRRHPILHAGSRRPGNAWVVPTLRQREILRRLADGATLNSVMREIGVCARTLRHELSRLAVANGACGPVHAGALYEALGWTPARAPALGPQGERMR